MPEVEYISQEKFDELTEELERLKHEKRKEVAERLSHARSLGDLAENAEYHAARDDQAKVEDRIAELTEMLKHAEIVKPHHSDVVEVGSTVVLKKGKDNDKVTYSIVGGEESDLSAGKISYKSPLGSAILGKSKKEEFSFETPKGKVNYIVVDIK
jgi:transcription elongation factor GreA